MEHQDKGGPQEVWQSLHVSEEQGMEMRLNTDQLCAMARYREKENVWGHWVAFSTLLVAGLASGYMAVTLEQVWQRLGAGWMVAVMGVALWGARAGARRFHAGESCAEFMVRELEGSGRTFLHIQWGIVLLLPTLLLFWYGDDGTLSPWRFPAVLAFLLAMWVAMGLEARKRRRQAEGLGRAIGVRE